MNHENITEVREVTSRTGRDTRREYSEFCLLERNGKVQGRDLEPELVGNVGVPPKTVRSPESSLGSYRVPVSF